jgi:hypothetical protein
MKHQSIQGITRVDIYIDKAALRKSSFVFLSPKLRKKQSEANQKKTRGTRQPN